MRKATKLEAQQHTWTAQSQEPESDTITEDNIMIHTIKAQLQVLESYTDLAMETENPNLIKDLFYYVGYLKGMIDGGTEDYGKVDEYTTNEIYTLYQELSHIEHEQSLAGDNS